eukprot:jgi/Picre1/34740/NNA_002206.t1
MYARVILFFAVLAMLAVQTFAGLCRTGFGTPGDKTETKSWEAIFARRQPDMPNNPKKATYGANWSKVVKKYPSIKKNAPKVIKSLEKSGFKMTKKFNFRMPYTRVCVPTKYGLKNGLKKGDMVVRVNPNGYKTDAKSKLFYKAFVRNNRAQVAGRTVSEKGIYKYRCRNASVFDLNARRRIAVTMKRSRDDLSLNRIQKLLRKIKYESDLRSKSAPRERPRTVRSKVVPLATNARVPAELQRVGEPGTHINGDRVVQIRCHCIGDHFDRNALLEKIFKRTQAPSVKTFSEVLVALHSQVDREDVQTVLYFDWGCVCICEDFRDTEVDDFLLDDVALPCVEDQYSPNEREDDHLKDENILLAVGFAMAQSLKLRKLESDLKGYVEDISFVPEKLAATGEIPVPAQDIMQFIGFLYRQMNHVNLVGPALDTPDDLPNEELIRSLYRDVYEYLEVQERLGIMHDRFEIVRDMLELFVALFQVFYEFFY